MEHFRGIIDIIGDIEEVHLVDEVDPTHDLKLIHHEGHHSLQQTVKHLLVCIFELRNLHVVASLAAGELFSWVSAIPVPRFILMEERRDGLADHRHLVEVMFDFESHLEHLVLLKLVHVCL